jgi:hypothetical protein
VPESSQNEPRPPRPRRAAWKPYPAPGPLRTWLIAFFAFFALSAAWALATPLTASPDEPAHMVKAAAIAHGQLSGVPATTTISINGVTTHQALTGFRLPGQYAQLDSMHRCYYDSKNATAACAAPLADTGGDTLVQTSAGGSNPLYYAAVGWPTLFSDGQTGLYLMRLVSAAICAAMLAGAAVTASTWSRNRSWPLLAVAVTATPTALFLNGTVNPNAVEVSGAVLLWTAMLALFTDPQPRLTTSRLARAGIASVLLANVRPLGPFWIIGVLLCALLVSQKGTFRVLLRQPVLWIWSGVVAAATLAAFAWSVHTSALTAASVDRPDLTFAKAAIYTFDHTMYYVDSMVAIFGWLDVRSPKFTHYSWYAVIGVTALLALWFGRLRERLAIFGLVAAIVVIPMMAQGKQAASLGYIWQGRYLLAVAVGLPLLAAAVLARRIDGGHRRTAAAVVRGTLALTTAGGLLAFAITLHRYADGVDGPWLPSHHSWTPPGGFLTVVALYLVGAAALIALVIRADAASRATQAASIGQLPERAADPEPHIPAQLSLRSLADAAALEPGRLA